MEMNFTREEILTSIENLKKGQKMRRELALEALEAASRKTFEGQWIAYAVRIKELEAMLEICE
jgi:hypothetical protein